MTFIYFESKLLGINLDRVVWYSTNVDETTLNIKMSSGERFFIQDEEEISDFLDVVTLMELESEEE